MVLGPSPPQPGPHVVGAPCLTRLPGLGRMKLGLTLSWEPPGSPHPPTPAVAPSPDPAGSPPFQLVSTMHLPLGVLVFYFL